MGRRQQSPVSPDAARRRYPAAVLTLLRERHLDECREVGRKEGGCGRQPPELARLQLQAAELAGTRTILMVPLCKDGRLLGDDAEAAQFPDLLARSSEILRDLGVALGDPPVWEDLQFNKGLAGAPPEAVGAARDTAMIAAVAKPRRSPAIYFSSQTSSKREPL
jgi:hypothetical protein